MLVLLTQMQVINLRAYIQELNMRLAKFDELDSLIHGMLYVETNNPRECYYWINPTEDERCEKRFFDFSDPYPFLVSQHGSWQCGRRNIFACISHVVILKSSILCY